MVWRAIAVIVFDPMKALCCAALLDPLISIITCEFSADALLESMEETVEMYTEEFTGVSLINANHNVP